MADTKQTVEGGALLDALKKLLFKGLDNVLNYAVDYQEEDGVPKQIYTIPISPKGSEDEYKLTLKLAPVKDKNGYYYVEAQCDDPEFNVDPINKKTVRLDGRHADEFREYIDKLIDQNGYESLEDADEDVQEEQTAEQEESELTEEQEAEVEELRDELEAKFEEIPVRAINEDNEEVEIVVSISNDSKEGGHVGEICTVEFTVNDMNGNIMNYPKDAYEIDTIEDDGTTMPFSSFYNEVKECIKEYASENQLTLKENSMFSSTEVRATFIKSSETHDIELTAITASCDIHAAMDIISDIAESDEFDEMIGEEPVSLLITEDEDGYTLDEIDDVDTSNSYCDMFKEVCIANSALKTYQWALGYNTWSEDSFLSSCLYPVSNLLDNCAVWVISHTDKFPNVIGTFGNDCTDLEDVKDADGVSVDMVHDHVKALFEGLIETLDIYYVNLDHNEQKVVDDFMNEAKRLLAYA